MHVTMGCPRCGQENARVLQHCWACGEWLHGASPVVGVCPQCYIPVRESQVVCPNCGIYLAVWVREEIARRRAEERRDARRARRVIIQPAPAAPRVSAALICRALGVLLVAVALIRAATLAQQYATVVAPNQASLMVTAALVWSGVLVLGIMLLLIGLYGLRPPQP